MKHISLRITSLVFSLVFSLSLCAEIIPSVTLTDYYAAADGKTSDALRQALYNIIKGHTVVDYDDLEILMQWADTEDADGSTIVDIYSNCTYSAPITSWASSGTVGGGMNREHTVPQSWFNKESPMVSDAFHIYPTDCKSNNNRSSYLFGEFSGAGTSYSSSSCSELGKLSTGNENSITSYTYNGKTYSPTASHTGKVYEPGDEYKGDIARGYFYMATRYASGSGNANCSNWTGGAFGSDNNGLATYTAELMLKWHRLDPVSEKELIRNEAIYGNTTYNKGTKKQNNRNPFIDYPELVEYIWGDKKGTSVDISSLTSAYEEGATTTTKYTITWSKDGNTETTTEVKENARPTPPEAADCDDDRVFMGWTDASTYSGDGSDLMTEQSDFLQVVGPATYYAVYADKGTSSGGGSTEITLDATKDTSFPKDGITLSTSNGVLNNGTDYRIYKSATLTITSTVGDMSSIAFTFDGTYDGGGWETSYSPNAATWTSPACTSGSSGKQARIKTIVVTVGGGSTSYSNYSTECSTCEKVTITFHENGGTGSMDAQQVCPSTNVALKANTFTREHYTFAGWSLTAGGTKALDNQETVNITANLDLYALWDPETQYTATFMNNGASYATRTGYAGETFAEAVTNPEPCKAGYTFAGWITTTITDSTATNPSAATVTTYPAANTTYYAVYKWDVEDAGGGESNDFALFSGTLTEGDYIIYYDGKAMDTTVTSDRLQYVEVTPSDNKITTTNAAIIWHIAASGDYWTIYNADDAKYAASTGAKNKAQMLASGTDDKALWTASGTSTYEFVNKQNTTSSVNANLRNNGTYGFACYANTTGGALSLYKREGGSGTTTYYATSPNCEEQCTLTITVQSPDDAKGTVGFDE